MKLRGISRFLALIFLPICCLIFLRILIHTDLQPVSHVTVKHQNNDKPTSPDIPANTKNEQNEIMSIFYRLSNDPRYHYEFRFEFSPSTKNDDHRLMLILYGSKRLCMDMWQFPVGIRTLAGIRSYNYSILGICSQQLTYDVNVPIQSNKDAQYIYLSLQIWMNTVYYQRFKQYPRLYIHATSRGSKFAGILSRVLPIQAQILYIYPGHRMTMFLPSDHDIDMQTRLILDPTFANWFYFDFCYNTNKPSNKKRTLCPFNHDANYYYPFPPAYFTYLQDDPYQNVTPYKFIVDQLVRNGAHLGGILFSKIEKLPLDILPPLKINVSYMQEHYYPWKSKPHTAQLFFEHFSKPELYKVDNKDQQTCWCSPIDFKYFESKPTLTMTWSRKRREEYSDYIKDIRKNINGFCEEICGDILTTHAMVSRNINKSLEWIYQIDQLRHSIFESSKKNKTNILRAF